MIVATIITIIAILSVGSLYLYAALQTNLRRQADPVRTGIEPQFAHLGEQDWYQATLTSSEWARS